METQIFHHAKNIIFKTSSKRNQNPLRYIITVEDAGVFAFMGYFKQREKNHKRRI
jgi:hypothetical protein